MKKLVLLLFAGAFVLASCESKTDNKSAFNLDSTKAEVAAFNEVFSKAVSDQDTVGFSQLFTEDAVRMPPNSPELVGRASIVSATSAALKAGIASGKKTTTDVWGDENMITEIGTYELLMKDGSLFEKGKYIALLKKVDGKLLCVRDIWNADAPAK